MIKPLAIVFALFFFSTFAVVAAEWSSCEKELSIAQVNARGAGERASSLATIERRVASAKERHERCSQYPDNYDFYDDGCQTHRNEYQEMIEQYNSEVSNFNGELKSLIERTESVISRCG